MISQINSKEPGGVDWEIFSLQQKDYFVTIYLQILYLSKQISYIYEWYSHIKNQNYIWKRHEITIIKISTVTIKNHGIYFQAKITNKKPIQNNMIHMKCES